ncbi:hypothetical protein [Actinoplanes sp. DH11]|uniref:hypothetical protein n=1 Tax=Actinoplanes sp. DH11 TaxID=2857011 RepID=UPI001E2F2FF8|nr:hypothetical protein [Actinoplanes sp. DH11]
MAETRESLGEPAWRLFTGLHRLLLRLAGRVPDDWLNHVRTRIATGELAEVPDTISGTTAELRVPLTAGEVALLRELVLLLHGDREPMRIEQVVVAERTPASAHRFFPVPAEVLATDAARIPAHLDLSGTDDLWQLPPHLAHLDDLAMRLTDLTDTAPVVALGQRDDVLSIARAWRFPLDGPPVDGVRVLLVEVASGAPAWDVARTAERDMDEAGAQVEAYWAGDELPPYHRRALAGAAVLWKRS